MKTIRLPFMAKQLSFEKLVFAVLAAVALVFFIITLNKELRTAVHNKLTEQRTVLSQIEDQSGGTEVKILKVSDGREIWIEAFFTQAKADASGEQIALTQPNVFKIAVVEHGWNAITLYQNRPAQMWMQDIDDDGQPELFVPYLDSNLQAHIKSYRIQKVAGRLDPILSRFETQNTRSVAMNND